MHRQLGRTVAIIIVIAMLATLTLGRRARQMRRQLPRGSPPAGVGATPTGIGVRGARGPDSDSIAAVTAAVRALQADDSAHGWGSIPLQVFKFERDTGGALVTLLPVDPTVRGGGGLIRVARGGAARLIERYQ